MPEGFDFEGIPTWEKLSLGVAAIELAEDNPEHTLQIALTGRDVQYLAVGVLLVGSLFPEMLTKGRDLFARLIELGDHQGFFESREDSDADDGR